MPLVRTNGTAEVQRKASWPGTIGAGNDVVPISQRSTAAAQERPSAMAQTMRL
jgi:hypothetical protein